jgi:16S rRNA C967 or C1407 C5-methylase (RsmB/RsmF family)
MYQADNDFIRGARDQATERHEKNVRGLDCSIMYWTLKDLARRSGRTYWEVTGALARGEFTPARAGSQGVPVLVHPEEGQRWIDSIKKEAA